MPEPIVINIVKNGFIVRRFSPEKYSDTSDEATVIFETHKGLFDYLEKTYPISIDASIDD